MSYAAAVEADLRIIWSLCARDTKRMHRASPFGVLSALIEPLAVILLMTFVLGAVRMKIPGMGDFLFLFITTGVCPIYMFRRGTRSVERHVISSRQLLWFPNLRPVHLMFAGLLQAFLTMSALFVAITIAFKLLYKVPSPENMLMAMVPLLCNGLIAYGFGSMNLVIRSWFPFWSTIFSTMFAPLGLLSGLFLSADALPDRVLKYLYYNPILHSTELCRTWYFPDYTSDFFDGHYYYGWALGAFAMGLLIERVYRHRILAAPKK